MGFCKKCGAYKEGTICTQCGMSGNVELSNERLQEKGSTTWMIIYSSIFLIVTVAAIIFSLLFPENNNDWCGWEGGNSPSLANLAESNFHSDIFAAVNMEEHVRNTKIVDELGKSDFNFDVPTKDGYKNYIDFTLKQGSDWYLYFNDDGGEQRNRGISFGDTYFDVRKAYGEGRVITVDYADIYKKHLKDYLVPKKALEYSYQEKQMSYYKRFYFDWEERLIMIIWHCREAND